MFQPCARSAAGGVVGPCATGDDVVWRLARRGVGVAVEVFRVSYGGTVEDVSLLPDGDELPAELYPTPPPGGCNLVASNRFFQIAPTCGTKHACAPGKWLMWGAGAFAMAAVAAGQAAAEEARIAEEQQHAAEGMAEEGGEHEPRPDESVAE